MESEMLRIKRENRAMCSAIPTMEIMKGEMKE